MSVDQSNVIDLVGTDKRTGDVVLTISDHLGWNDEHLLALQEKLNAYLRYIESGEAYTSYPSSKGRNFLIEVALLYRPNEAGTSFLERARTIVAGAGIGFRYGPLGSGYANDGA